MAPKMTYPETFDKVIRRNGEEVTTAYMAPDQDETFTVFFTYEGPDDRFPYGVKKGLTQEQAEAKIDAEEKRLNHD